MSNSNDALYIFAWEIVKRGLLDAIGKDVAWLYNALKPKLLEIAKQAGICLVKSTASIIETAKHLIYKVAGSPIFWVALTTGVSVLVQLQLEKAGHNTAGKVVGATGFGIGGGLLGFMFSPAVLPVMAGAMLGLGVWSFGNKMIDMFIIEQRYKELIANATPVAL